VIGQFEVGVVNALFARRGSLYRNGSFEDFPGVVLVLATSRKQTHFSVLAEYVSALTVLLVSREACETCRRLGSGWSACSPRGSARRSGRSSPRRSCSRGTEGKAERSRPRKRVTASK